MRSITLKAGAPLFGVALPLLDTDDVQRLMHEPLVLKKIQTEWPMARTGNPLPPKMEHWLFVF
jgi:hypothetical protein